MVLMIPEGPQPDHVRLVVQAAWEAGFDAGGCQLALETIRLWQFRDLSG
jgi:hypothetical protein